jgi:UDP-3-O-[3-hydroxymyristoyl] glucosamine N-acyltransferase
MVAPAYAVPVVPPARAPAGVVMASAGFTAMDAVVADFVGSLMLVAVTVTLEATAAVAVRVVAGELPAAVDGLTVPAPTEANVAPEALESFATVAARASVWPESRVTPVVTVENETVIGLSVIVADAVLLGSLTLVAVTTAVAAVTGLADV